jgi:hypothetical protein
MQRFGPTRRVEWPVPSPANVAALAEVRQMAGAGAGLFAGLLLAAKNEQSRADFPHGFAQTQT